MEYWQGSMGWTLSPDWLCETCGENKGLIWGMAHAQCRCNQCHTQYTMRDYSLPDNPVVKIPICTLKPEYKEPAKKGWLEHQIPISQWDDDTWSNLMEDSQ